MSTFTLPGSSPACEVHLNDELKKDQLLSFPAFKHWISTLQHSFKQQEHKNHTFHAAPYNLRRIDIQHVDYFGKNKERIGFIKLNTLVTNDNDEYLPGSVFLRGGSVAMLLLLQADDVPANSEQDKYAIMTLQPRIPAGSLSFCEIPAGMLDDSGSFSGGAAKEIEEETGLTVSEDDLIDLTALALAHEPQESGQEQLPKATYPSAGGCDEFVPIFLYQKRIPRDQLQSWQGKLTGLREHGEKITLRLVRLQDLWREGVRDAKTLSAWALYQGLKTESKL
ncbi:hypothetical protein AAFC00_004049 [Neodothiora populina]|uniref:Nudix hydrolase domain-containing protein n=1 Tax=Neodothiora populina TaxID=2781224 RepID=A0ABR3PJG6_9PEZI